MKLGSKLFSAFYSAVLGSLVVSLSVRHAIAHAGAAYSIVGHLKERIYLLLQRWFTYLEISAVFQTVLTK